MERNGTRSDYLTLLAMMGEYNLQCIALSSGGAEHSTVVSNDGTVDKKTQTITLSYMKMQALTT